jgi:hypothetical protein
MKRIIIILVIIAIICALNIYTGIFINTSSVELRSEIDQTKTALQAKDNATAASQIKKIRNQWESVESRWEVLVDHRDVDRIDTLMTHLEAMAATDSWDTVMPELDELAFYLTHIDDKQKFRVENIF